MYAHTALSGEIALDNSEPGTSGDAFALRLRSLGSIRSLSLRIDSCGGSAASMWKMVDAILDLRRQGVEVVAHIDSARSAAAAVAVACKRRIISWRGCFMVHPATHHATTDAYVEFLAFHTGNSRERVAEWVRRETWFDHNDALQWGFATSIAQAAEVRIPRDLTNKNRP